MKNLQNSGPGSSVVVSSGDSYEIMHGVRIPDRYRWLEGGGPAVLAWAREQHQATQGLIDATHYVDVVRKRLAAFAAGGRIASPIVCGKVCFRLERLPGERSQIITIAETPAGQHRRLFDPSDLPEIERFTITSIYPSPKGSFLAARISPKNNNCGEVVTLDVATAAMLDDRIPEHLYPLVYQKRSWEQMLAWMPDEKAFYYVRGDSDAQQDTALFGQKLWLHRRGTSWAEDRLVLGFGFDRKDVPSHISISEDGRFVVVTVNRYAVDSHTTDVFVGTIDADSPVPDFVKLELPRGFHSAKVAQGSLYLLSTASAPRGTVLRHSLVSRDQFGSAWQTIVAHSNRRINDFWPLYGCVVVHDTDVCLDSLRVYDANSLEQQALPLPTGTIEQVTIDSKNHRVFCEMSSLCRPRSVFSYTLGTRELVPLEALTFPDYDPDDYRVTVRWCASADGTRVPMILCHQANLVLDGSNPTVVFVYGAYGNTIIPGFYSFKVPLLEQGVVIAIAGVRGGGELGEEWARAALRENKYLSHEDYIAVCRYLIREGYTNTDRLCAAGKSNGGTTALASVLKEPELFGAALIRMAVTDAIRCRHFKHGDYWTKEIGDPEIPNQFTALMCWSPLHNVRPRRYPPILQVAGLHDDSVPALHAFKMTAELQAQADARGGPFHLWLTEGSHRPASTAEGFVDEWAPLWGWVLSHIMKK